ncbi:MAG TPA: DUF3303 family protein [Bryobacteraceae bacterium]|nr:DUF3303 family protein [Bryobacteraceae bacterium]
MKIMIVWRTVPGKYRTALEAFLRAGGPVPPEAKTIGRWHAPGSIIGWHLIEGDLTAVAQHVAQWADLLQCEVYPVMEDTEAATAANKVFGK